MSEEFLKFEKDMSLFSKRITGIFFWERIRFRVYTYIYNNIAGETTTSFATKHSHKNLILFYIRAFVNIFKNPFLCRKKDILFVNSPRRLMFEDGYWWDIYVDPILAKISRSYVLLEPDFRLQHRAPAKTKNMRYMDFLVLLTEIKKRLGLCKLRFSPAERKLIRQIEVTIYDRFGVKMNLRDLIYNVLLKRKTILPLYNIMLKRIKPKAIVCIVGYGKEDLIEAANELAIPVVELQHGVIYPMHLGYSFEGEHATKRTFPNYLLLFGDYWCDSAKFPLPKDRIISVGYPYMEIQMQKYAHLIKKKQILFISQWGIGNSIPQFAVHFSKIINGEYNIIYKLHPGEWHNWRERYPELLDSDIEIIEGRGTILYKLFAESIIQIGVSSTALFEGLAFGLRTFLIDAPSVGFLSKLETSGYAKRVSAPEELLEYLHEHKESKLFDTEYFFRHNAVRNIIAFLDRLISVSK
ncbi:MAG: hypothetical protein K9W43_07065 [Candidatus Thorarchaeota archaeon]|nr:hypothetical protein [Candidatus Thorarchaeota archaeon]